MRKCIIIMFIEIKLIKIIKITKIKLCSNK